MCVSLDVSVLVLCAGSVVSLSRNGSCVLQLEAGCGREGAREEIWRNQRRVGGRPPETSQRAGKRASEPTRERTSKQAHK